MPKIIRIRDCLDCPLANIKHQAKIKEHGGFVYCESAKFPKPRTIGTFFYVSTLNYIPRWCPLQDEEDYLRERKI